MACAPLRVMNMWSSINFKFTILCLRPLHLNLVYLFYEVNMIVELYKNKNQKYKALKRYLYV